MRVLVTWGTKLGGTEGLAREVAAELKEEGLEVQLLPAHEALSARGFDAVIVGGALYAGRWQKDARRFVLERLEELRRVPVWFFTSGPLDDSADREELAPTAQVKMLMERVGAVGHVTFGGRLPSDAKGFPASAMAKKNSGDWRNMTSVRAWAEEIGRALPTARPGAVIAQPGGSVARLVGHAVLGWAACAAVLLGVSFGSFGAAVALYAIAAAVVFALVGRHYFKPSGARGAIPTALAFAGIAAALDLGVVFALAQRGVSWLAAGLGTGLPLLLIFGVTWATGEMIWMSAPPPRPKTPAGQTPAAAH